MSAIRSRGRDRWVRAALMVLVAAFLMAGCRTLEDMSFSKIDPTVVTALTGSGRAEVMVSLVPPRGYGEVGADLDALKVEVARAQDDVLASLDANVYRNRIRFDAIPGMAGTVLDQRALAVFEGHPLEHVSAETRSTYLTGPNRRRRRWLHRPRPSLPSHRAHPAP